MWQIRTVSWKTARTLKLLLDNQFESSWKTIELTGMDQQYGDMLWRSYAPECVLNRLHSTLLADSLRTWYIYREKACKEIHNTSLYDMGNMQCLWFNRNIRSRTKQYLFYEDWYEKGIRFISDLLSGWQLAEMKKEYSWHVPAMKFIGMKQLLRYLWKIFTNIVIFHFSIFTFNVKFGAISWKFDILSITA